ncbi:MAG: hypothetical protein V1775_00030 [Bacteroidota bacterium]
MNYRNFGLSLPPRRNSGASCQRLWDYGFIEEHLKIEGGLAICLTNPVNLKQTGSKSYRSHRKLERKKNTDITDVTDYHRLKIISAGIRQICVIRVQNNWPGN